MLFFYTLEKIDFFAYRPKQLKGWLIKKSEHEIQKVILLSLKTATSLCLWPAAPRGARSALSLLFIIIYPLLDHTICTI